MKNVIIGVLLPFIGTSLGAACVFPMKKELGRSVQCILTGFAAGVMTAASVWSLLLPAIGQSEEKMGRLAFMPAAWGFAGGVLFLLLLDRLTPHLHMHSSQSEGIRAHLSRNTMLMLAVTLHNLPEGMAVGAVYAGLYYGSPDITQAAALALAAGIAVQNLPEGAIISMPLSSSGVSRPRSFALGVLSGAVEPVGAVATLLAAGLVIPAMPYILSFAAGAMIYVVVEELIPEIARGEHIDAGTIAFSSGFLAMMILDTALG